MVDDAGEHKSEQTQHSSPCPEADFSIWDLSHTHTKQMFSCKFSNHLCVCDLNCKLEVAIVHKGFEWLRNVHL